MRASSIITAASRWKVCGLELLWAAWVFGWVAPPGLAADQPPAQDAAAAASVLAEWTFDQDFQGWQANGHLADVRVSEGTVHCRGAGSDPILECGPWLGLRASPWQVLEVRLRADRAGTAEFFWSNTTQGRYAGFAQEKSTRFEVLGDGQWHRYRVFPFWHPEKKIVRLRFDLYDGAVFDLDSIRVVEFAMAAGAPTPEFEFVGELRGWQALDGASATPGRDGMALVVGRTDGFVLGPPVEFEASGRSYVSLRMSINQGAHATVLFATDQAYGLHQLTFPIEADGQEHTYNIDMLAASAWRERIIALGLRPSDVAGAQGKLRWMGAVAEPSGRPDLRVGWFGLEEGLGRVGVPGTVTGILSNKGGQTATNVQAALTLPAGVKILDRAPAEQRVARLGFGEETILRWKVASERPVARAAASARLQWTADNAPPVSANGPLGFAPRLETPPTGYVPEPQPVRGRYEVGVYYFPGWKTASQWHPIQRFPERKPVLGWYREGDPEVADWHIKWAVEHGITFFVYDWYWSQGNRQLEHALHEGYFKARYRHLLKFCLLWANHNPPRTSSVEDCLAVTRHWVETYFRRPEYLSIDRRPVVIIFSPDRLSEDLGTANVKGALEAMRGECRRSGLERLYLIACVGHAGQARQAAEEGYDAVTAYNWPGLGRVGDELCAPFATLLEGYRQNWAHILEQSHIPLLLPLNGGWDSRPWHGENNLVRFGRTPELFKRHVQDGKEFLEQHNVKSATGNFMLVEAWNEWGEGSYIEPHAEHGFGFLDALREVVAPEAGPHQDVIPSDVGRGPYDVAFQPARTDWRLAKDDQGWVNTMGMADLSAREDGLCARTTSRDPAFFGPPTQVRASEFPVVEIRLRLRNLSGKVAQDTAQLFWGTAQRAESEANSVRFPVTLDGQWHDYRVQVADNGRWRGVITRLRLDPCDRAGVEVCLERIRLVGVGSSSLQANDDWPRYARDGAMTSRSPLHGKIAQPRQAWTYSVAGREWLLQVTPTEGDRRVQLREPEASKRLCPRQLTAPGPASVDLDGSGALRPVRESFHERWTKILPDVPVWQRVAWSHTWTDQKVCRLQLFAYDQGFDRPRLAWQTDPPEDTIFQPLNIVCDIDRDGVAEICVAAHYRVMIFEGTTGRKETELRYHQSRPYGWFGLADVDADGPLELVTIGDFQSHVDVLRYDPGKPEAERLSVAWRRDIEQNIEERRKWPEVGPHPLIDAMGDPQLELVLNLFNDTGDGQWHAVVWNAVTGQAIHDFPRRFIHGAADVDCDGRADLFLSDTDGVTVPAFGEIELVGFKEGVAKVLWSQRMAMWAAADWPAFGPHWSTTASQGMRHALVTPGRDGARPVFMVVSRSGQTNPPFASTLAALQIGPQGSATALWQVAGLVGELETIALSCLDSKPGAGALMRLRVPADAELELRSANSEVCLVESRSLGVPAAPPVAARLRRDDPMTVVVEGPAEQVYAIRAPTGAGRAPQLLWRRSGRGTSDGSRRLGLVAADLDGDGGKEVIVADQDASGLALLVAYRHDGSRLW